MTLYLQFGWIGDRISNEIPCANVRQASILAANIARVAGCFAENAEDPINWIIDRKTTRICWESAGKSYFVELIKR